MNDTFIIRIDWAAGTQSTFKFADEDDAARFLAELNYATQSLYQMRNTGDEVCWCVETKGLSERITSVQFTDGDNHPVLTYTML